MLRVPLAVSPEGVNDKPLNPVREGLTVDCRHACVMGVVCVLRVIPLIVELRMLLGYLVDCNTPWVIGVVCVFRVMALNALADWLRELRLFPDFNLDKYDWDTEPVRERDRPADRLERDPDLPVLNFVVRNDPPVLVWDL